MRTKVEILNSSLVKVAEIKNLYPINQDGMILRYSRELSDYGYCRFRIQTKDPVLTQYGDILKPHAYHVRVVRGDETVFQGAIVSNPDRNRNYVEVEAAEYLYYLNKILIRRDKDNPNTADIDEANFKLYDSGTMKTAVTNLINNAAADFNDNHIMAGMTIGTIENPNYPNNFVKANGNKLSGAWSFSDDVVLQFDYHDVLYALRSFGIHSQADFRLNNDLTFDFKKQMGERKNITFKYGTLGTNITDYNVLRVGQRMVNELIGIGVDNEGNVLHVAERDTNSINTYGLLQEVRAFSDVKSKNIIKARLREELRLISEPEESPINIVLSEKAYPINQYEIGDIVNVIIKDHAIDYRKERRIVGITINLHNTGREQIVIQTNTVPDNLKGNQ